MHDARAGALVRVVRETKQDALGAEFQLQGLQRSGAGVGERHHGGHAGAAAGRLATAGTELGDGIQEAGDDLRVGFAALGGRGTRRDRNLPARFRRGAFQPVKRDGAAAGRDGEARDERRVEVRRPGVGERFAGGEPVGQQAGFDEEDGGVVLELGAEHGRLRRRRLADQEDLTTRVAFEREAKRRRREAGGFFGEGDELAGAQVREVGDRPRGRFGVGERVVRGLEAPFGRLDTSADAGPDFRSERGHDLAVLRAMADRDRARFEIRDLEDLVHSVAFRLRRQGGGHGFGQRDDPLAVLGEQEVMASGGLHADLDLDDGARLRDDLEAPARRLESVILEPGSVGLGFARVKAALHADEAEFIKQALDGPDVRRPVERLGQAPDRTAFLEHDSLRAFGEGDFRRRRREELGLADGGGPMAGRSLPDEPEGDQVGDQQDDGGAGDPHVQVNFCDATRKPQALLRGRPEESGRIGAPGPRSPPRSR